MGMEFKTRIISIIDETHDVKTFTLEKPNNFIFFPGQFCMVGFVTVDAIDKKPFTIASSPDSSYIQFTIKKMGLFTTNLFNLKNGDELIIDGPFGESLNFNESLKKIVYIAGGSGVTPFMSHIRHITQTNLNQEVYLFFSNKTKRDIIYYEEISIIAKEHKNVHIIFTVSDEIDKTQNSSEKNIETGRITSSLILKYVKTPYDYTYYLCGPPPMISSISEQLLSIGIDSEKIIFEAWQLPGKNG